MYISLIGAGVMGGLLFAILMPYMPSPGWTLSIVFCYALGSVAFLNAYASRKKKRGRQREAERTHVPSVQCPVGNAIEDHGAGVNKEETAVEAASPEESAETAEGGIMGMDDGVRCTTELIGRDCEQAEMRSLQEELEGIEKAIAEYDECTDHPESRRPEETIDELIAQWSRRERTAFKSPEL